MFEHTSRYHTLETAEHTTRDGRVIAYKRRRFVPRAGSLPTMRETTVAPGDRLDIIAANTLGDPQQFWRICDANTILDPFEVAEQEGRSLRIPVPQP